jgi:hypothetical protein
MKPRGSNWAFGDLMFNINVKPKCVSSKQYKSNRLLGTQVKIFTIDCTKRTLININLGIFHDDHRLKINQQTADASYNDDSEA